MSIEHTRVFYTLLMDYDSSVQTSSSPSTAPTASETDTEDPLLELLAPDSENRAGMKRERKFQHALLPLPAATRQGVLVPFSSFQSVIYFF